MNTKEFNDQEEMLIAIIDQFNYLSGQAYIRANEALKNNDMTAYIKHKKHTVKQLNNANLFMTALEILQTTKSSESTNAFLDSITKK